MSFYDFLFRWTKSGLLFEKKSLGWGGKVKWLYEDWKLLCSFQICSCKCFERREMYSIWIVVYWNSLHVYMYSTSKKMLTSNNFPYFIIFCGYCYFFLCLPSVSVHQCKTFVYGYIKAWFYYVLCFRTSCLCIEWVLVSHAL